MGSSVQSDPNDIMFILGPALVIFGAYCIWFPLAVIVGVSWAALMAISMIKN